MVSKKRSVIKEYYMRLTLIFSALLESGFNCLHNFGIYKRNMATLPSSSLQGKICVITGSNSGIGFNTAKVFSKLGAKVIMCCRDLNKANEAVENIKNELTNEQGENDASTKSKKDQPLQHFILIRLDLSSLKSVRECARLICDQVTQIDYLINNAGIMMCKERKTEDGIESQFATNYLGHFLLTYLLMDKLKQAPEARIINLSSMAHFEGYMNLENINLEGCYTPLKAYSQSKLAIVLFTLELAKKLQSTNITAYTVHPGLVNTDLKRHLSGLQQRLLSWFNSFILISPELGAQTTLFCAFEKGLEYYSGEYFENCQLKRLSSHAKDENVARKLWELSMSMCNIPMINNNHKSIY